jgi:hypothetical protein
LSLGDIKMIVIASSTGGFWQSEREEKTNKGVTGCCKGESEKADGDVRKTEREEKEEEGVVLTWQRYKRERANATDSKHHPWKRAWQPGRALPGRSGPEHR